MGARRSSNRTSPRRRLRRPWRRHAGLIVRARARGVYCWSAIELDSPAEPLTVPAQVTARHASGVDFPQ